MWNLHHKYTLLKSDIFYDSAKWMTFDRWMWWCEIKLKLHKNIIKKFKNKLISIKNQI